MSTEVVEHMTGDAPRSTLTVLRRGALIVADAGYAVFPVRPGLKVPAIDDWEQHATCNRTQVQQWWRSTPFNIGLATGPSGLVVVDLDDGHGEPAPPAFAGARHGLDVLVQLAAAAEVPVPTDTFAVRTPTGGYHLYFQAPPGVELRNTQGRLGWRIDTRAHGGFVVAAGSIRPQGRYQVSDPARPVRALPDWLLQALTPPPAPSAPASAPLQLSPGRASAYLHAIVAGEAAQVETAPPGRSHWTLLRAALRLGNLVGGGELTEDEARAALLPAATAHFGRWRCDCTEASVRCTIDDGIDYGRQRPRRLGSP